MRLTPDNYVSGEPVSLVLKYRQRILLHNFISSLVIKTKTKKLNVNSFKNSELFFSYRNTKAQYRNS